MADIADSKWTENDAGNDSPAPDGIQGGYAPSTLAAILRGTRGPVKREFVQNNAVYTTTGSSSAYVLTYVQGPTAYVKGKKFAFTVNHTNTGPATLNINALGAKAIVLADGNPVSAGQIQSGLIIIAYYDGASFRITSPITHNVALTGVPTAPTAVAGTNTTQIATTEFAAAVATASAKAELPPFALGYLSYVSTTSIRLDPVDGGFLWIENKNHIIPTALTLSNSGLSSSSQFYIYAFMNVATMTLEASSTGYVISSKGIAQKIGDPTRTLVGKIATDGSGQFQPQGVGVISYYNRRTIARNSVGLETGSSGGPTLTQADIPNSVRVYFLSWGDEAISASICGHGYNSTTGSSILSTLAIDGVALMPTLVQTNNAFWRLNVTQHVNYQPTEGAHYICPFIGSDGAGLATFENLKSSVMVRG